MAGEEPEERSPGATLGKEARAGGIAATREIEAHPALPGERLHSPVRPLFAEVPVRPGTRICAVEGREIGGKSALWQRWRRPGLSGETIVLMETQVGYFVDDALRGLARESGLVRTGSAILVTRHCHGFAFLSFNLLASGRGSTNGTS